MRKESNSEEPCKRTNIFYFRDVNFDEGKNVCGRSFYLQCVINNKTAIVQLKKAIFRMTSLDVTIDLWGLVVWNLLEKLEELKKLSHYIPVCRQSFVRRYSGLAYNC